MPKKPISIINNHDFMSLVTPNGRFTMSWNGEKASGKLAMPSESTAFKALTNFVNTESKKPGMTMGKAFEQLADEKILASLWPNWNAKETNPFKGDGTETVQFIEDMKQYRAKKGNAKVLSIYKNGKDLVLQFEKETQPVRMSYIYFELI
jgi:hypothetical protein